MPLAFVYNANIDPSILWLLTQRCYRLKTILSHNASQNDSGVLLCPKLTISQKNTQGNQWP